MQTNEQMEPLITLDQLTVGTVIVYRLRSYQLPTDPEERWRGKIIETFASRGSLLDVVLVQILDKGYEEEIETVLVEQIVEIENERDEDANRASCTC
jgi:hypothetical protein